MILAELQRACEAEAEEQLSETDLASEEEMDFYDEEDEWPSEIDKCDSVASAMQRLHEVNKHVFFMHGREIREMLRLKFDDFEKTTTTLQEEAPRSPCASESK